MNLAAFLALSFLPLILLCASFVTNHIMELVGLVSPIIPENCIVEKCSALEDELSQKHKDGSGSLLEP